MLKRIIPSRSTSSSSLLNPIHHNNTPPREFPNSKSYHRKAPEPTSPQITQLLSHYAAQPPRPLTLSTLLSFGLPLTRTSILHSVSYAQAEIPRRLATRVRSLEALPFIVGTNPYIANTLKAYRESFQWLATYPAVRSVEANGEFVAQLGRLVARHANDIPTMAKGFQECSRYLTPAQISNFLDAAIHNRISVRLIAEHHIALSRSFAATATATDGDRDHSAYVGVVNTTCSPRDMIKMCGSFVSELCDATLGASPSIVIDGHPEATFAYVPVHLEYILTEILKNAFRATMEHHFKRTNSAPHTHTHTQRIPPVTITISPPPPPPPPVVPAVSGSKSAFLSLRIRDQGGGVPPGNLDKVFSYAFTTAGRGGGTTGSGSSSAEDVAGGGGPYAAQHIGGSAAIGTGGLGSGGGSGEGSVFGEITTMGLQTGMGTIAGLGYGLPMSRLYANFFGGSLDFHSLDRWGTDVFLKLRCLDQAGDAKI